MRTEYQAEQRIKGGISALDEAKYRLAEILANQPFPLTPVYKRRITLARIRLSSARRRMARACVVYLETCRA